MSDEKITSKQILSWCRNFLRGTWSNVPVEKIRIDPISGGLTNSLYCCSLTDDVQTVHNEPRKAMLRIYGEAHQQHRSTLLIDSIVCILLSERKLGPQVYGIFPDGRVEEFIEAETLSVTDIRNENVTRKLGRLLGEIHQLNMPLVKKPIWLFKKMTRYISDLPNDLTKFQRETDREIYDELRSICNFTEEFQRMKEILSTIDSPVCFSHNDFRARNILRLKSQPFNFTIIDFEYCSYNYRAYDIATYFCEYMFDYQTVDEWPCFHVDFTLYPNENQQINFLTSYIDVLLSNNNHSNREITNYISRDKENVHRDELLRKLIKEANYFTLASHFFAALWAIHMAQTSTIQFGFMEYARARLTAYYLQYVLLTDVSNDIPSQFTHELIQSSKNPFRKHFIH